MELEVTCPSCGKQFGVEHDGTGGVRDCPHCGALLEFGGLPKEHAATTRRSTAKLYHLSSHASAPVPHKAIPTSSEPKPSGSIAEMVMWLAVIAIGVGFAWWWFRKPSLPTEPPSPLPAAPRVAISTATPPSAAVSPPVSVPRAPPAAETPPPPTPTPPPVAANEETEIALSNPGFEKAMEGWKIVRSAGLIRAMTDAAHSGNRGLRVADGSTERDTVVSRSFPFAAGDKYKCRFWARVVSGNGVTVALRFVNAEGQASGKSIEIPGDTKEWKEFTVTATAPERATESEISIATTADGTALTDFDDFRLLGLR